MSKGKSRDRKGQKPPKVKRNSRASNKTRNANRQLRMLVKRVKKDLPETTGCIGCGTCCCNIDTTGTEVAQLAQYLTKKNLWPTVAKNMQRQNDNDLYEVECPLRVPDGDVTYRCLGYPARPIVCRLQGTSHELPCQHVIVKPIFSKFLDQYRDLAEANKVKLRVELMEIIKDANTLTTEAKEVDAARERVEEALDIKNNPDRVIAIKEGDNIELIDTVWMEGPLWGKTRVTELENNQHEMIVDLNSGTTIALQDITSKIRVIENVNQYIIDRRRKIHGPDDKTAKLLEAAEMKRIADDEEKKKQVSTGDKMQDADEVQEKGKKPVHDQEA